MTAPLLRAIGEVHRWVRSVTNRSTDIRFTQRHAAFEVWADGELIARGHRCSGPRTPSCIGFYTFNMETLKPIGELWR